MRLQATRVGPLHLLPAAAEHIWVHRFVGKGLVVEDPRRRSCSIAKSRASVT